MQQTIRAGELRKVIGGSLQAHRALEEAVLFLLERAGVPATPIYTGPKIVPYRGGGLGWGKNPQRGMADILACIPPHGRLALLELKTGRAGRKRHQVETRVRYESAGALCLLVRSVADLEPIIGRVG